MEQQTILEVKALVITKATFGQIQMLSEDSFRTFVKQTSFAPWNVMNWCGYVIENIRITGGDHQVTWFVFEQNGGLRRVRDTNIHFILVDDKHPHPIDDLKRILQQIYVK